MCGIAGFITNEPFVPAELHARVKRMTDRLVHRGPDDSGTWADPAAGVALGFRRLSIVDLSPAGHQPMTSASGRYVIVFNGEVYNFPELRRDLESRNHIFRGHSDTEVMLAAISEWGLEPAAKRFVGMFAFALWDCREQTLHLVRDRLGIKPLYYGLSGDTFLFGSELKALRANPAFVPEIDRNALALFFRHQYVPQPHSIYKGIQKLAPGFILTLKKSSSGLLDRPTGHSYWSAKEVAEQGAGDLFRGTEREATEALDVLLREAIGLRMVADVPLGAFLSGGIDSSTVVSLMQAQSSRPIKTFTIGFHENEYNEAVHAKQVAIHLGTDHTELYLSPDQVFSVIPKLPSLYDEPFSDSSQLPTYLVSALAREQVTVSLSGDGGDELFGGYHHYFRGQSIWQKTGWMPYAVRRSLASTLRQASPETWGHLFDLIRPFFPSPYRMELRGDRVHKFADILAARNSEGFYKGFVSCWKTPTDLVVGAKEPATPFTDVRQWANVPNFLQQMMFFDVLTYLPDDILTKVDRASMGVSLEARVPLLDHRVVEFAARIPLGMKMRSGKGKWLLRQVLCRYVPKELIERRKMGFGIPLGTWLRGPLREWAEGLLDEKQMQRDGYLRPAPVRKLWADHLAGNHWGAHLWTVLMFQSWLQHWVKNQTESSPLVPQVVLQ